MRLHKLTRGFIPAPIRSIKSGLRFVKSTFRCAIKLVRGIVNIIFVLVSLPLWLGNALAKGVWFVFYGHQAKRRGHGWALQRVLMAWNVVITFLILYEGLFDQYWMPLIFFGHSRLCTT